MWVNFINGVYKWVFKGRKLFGAYINNFKMLSIFYLMCKWKKFVFQYWNVQLMKITCKAYDTTKANLRRF